MAFLAASSAISRSASRACAAASARSTPAIRSNPPSASGRATGTSTNPAKPPRRANSVRNRNESRTRAKPATIRAVAAATPTFRAPAHLADASAEPLRTKPPSVENAAVVTKIMCADASRARTRSRPEPDGPVSTTVTSPSAVPRQAASPSRAPAAAETGSRVARIEPACFQASRFVGFRFGVHLETYPCPFTFSTVTTSPSARKAAARCDATTRAPRFAAAAAIAGSRNANSLCFFATLQSAAPAFSCRAADSEDVVNTHASSGEKHTHVTASACAPISAVTAKPPARSPASAHSHTATRPSSVPMASFAPSDENAAHFTSQSASLDRAADPSAATRAGLTTYGEAPAPASASFEASSRWLAGGSAFSSSASAESLFGALGLGVTSYTATSPPKTHSTRELSGNITSACGAVSSVWQENSGSDSVSPSNVATHTRLGMPLDFLPPPPATRRERSSTHAEAYRGMPNFFAFGLGFFGAMAAGES